MRQQTPLSLHYQHVLLPLPHGIQEMPHGVLARHAPAAVGKGFESWNCISSARGCTGEQRCTAVVHVCAPRAQWHQATEGSNPGDARKRARLDNLHLMPAPSNSLHRIILLSHPLLSHVWSRNGDWASYCLDGIRAQRKCPSAHDAYDWTSTKMLQRRISVDSAVYDGMLIT